MSANRQTVFEAIDANYSSLSKTHRRIADFFKKNYDQAVFMTAAKLADKLSTSESTVVRFATAIGFSGYPQMQQNLRESIKTILTTRQKIATQLEPETFEGSLHQSFNRDLNDVRSTLDHLDVSTIHEIASGIQQSKHVYLLGMRSSKILVDYLDFYLSFLHKNVVSFHHGVADHFDQIINLEPGDLVIVVSFPRYAAITLDLAKIIKAQGNPVYAITDSPEAPINEYADKSIFATYSIDSFIDSHVAPMTLINALITAVAYDNLAEADKKFQRLEEIWDRHHVYI